MQSLTLQQEDINQVDYIDLLISNQRALEKKYMTDFEWMRERGEKITFKSMMERREEHFVKIEPKTFTLHNRKIILESDLTEDMIYEQIEFWFLNK